MSFKIWLIIMLHLVQLAVENESIRDIFRWSSHSLFHGILIIYIIEMAIRNRSYEYRLTFVIFSIIAVESDLSLGNLLDTTAT